MHEFSIMESALESAARSTQAAGATCIHRLKVRVGKLSGVEAVALRFAFDSLAPGSCAAGAELEIEEVAAVCWCPECLMEFEAADLKYECPRCHQLSSDLRRGAELELASLEIS
jgi:hydrogenase nickel incorporation protein HypA/HybF